VEKPQLTKEYGYYFVDDLFADQESGYYRLTFQEKSDKAEKVLLKLNAYAGKEIQIGEFILDPSNEFRSREVLFFLPEGFDGLLFQKENSSLAGNVFIETVNISRLNAANLSEATSLKKTIIGKTNTSAIESSQLGADYSFLGLKEAKSTLGQVFQANDAIISAVAMKIDINKNVNPGSRQYVLSLREVEYDKKKKSVSLIGPVLFDLSFSASSIEKYRQIDGSFLFPLYGALEKDKYYFVSLDNSKVEVGEQNYLELRGSQDSDSYPNGFVVMKKNKNLSIADGDLYFKIYGANYSLEDEAKILNGARIEEFGKGMGKYSYATTGKFMDLLDLSSASPGTDFSDSYRVIYAPAKDNASFSYIVNTIYPMGSVNFSATQLKAGWKKIKVSYSFDQNNWVDLPSSEKAEIAKPEDDLLADQSGATDSGESDNSNSNSAIDIYSDATVQENVQVFNADIVPPKEAQTVYFKITYDQTDKSKGRYFAIKNLKVTADLKM
jgi:hypothetical protein